MSVAKCEHKNKCIRPPKSLSEQTSEAVASKAGKILRSKRTSKYVKSVAASALTQAKDKKKIRKR